MTDRPTKLEVLGLGLALFAYKNILAFLESGAPIDEVKATVRLNIKSIQDEIDRGEMPS